MTRTTPSDADLDAHAKFSTLNGNVHAVDEDGNHVAIKCAPCGGEPVCGACVGESSEHRPHGVLVGERCGRSNLYRRSPCTERMARMLGGGTRCAYCGRACSPERVERAQLAQRERTAPLAA